ncbi:MAG: hypothetical protein WHV67_06320, partial [Thermoanaerobaculia bacterium]
MNVKFLTPEEELNKILETEKISFLKEIEELKLTRIEKTCRQNLLEPSFQNFLKLYPENYIRVLKKSFEKVHSKAGVKNILL